MDFAHCEECSDFFKGRIEFSANSGTLHDGLKILDYQRQFVDNIRPGIFSAPLVVEDRPPVVHKSNPWCAAPCASSH
ncbi:hypothetical protein T07_10563 [Trichinella nelsoni]|uniref:Uncharacterized protein n=1 Tax=Trichinella nelsoni TaxID=6336 RepID=A0A0V0REL9_9BILA|nr:hypothetical protein T07_10563 [Trichinella nelsoni]